MQQYDVAIVGARIAGATLAALLGDAGYRVLLIDRAAFPSATLSTHFFRGAHAVAVLQRLGVLDEVLALDCPPLTRQYMYSNGLPEPAVGPPQDPGTIGYALSVRRESLDHILVRRAAAVPTVEVMERTRATELLYDDGRVTGLRLSGSDGDRTVRARIVVGADGRHSFVARSVKPTAELSHPPFRAAYYCYVSNFPGPEGRPSDGPEFSMLGSEIAYVFPSDAGVTCVALTIDLNEYPAFRARAESAFREHIASHQGLAERFAAATWESRLLACGPEPNWVRKPIGPGWALAGDAGIHQDPWSGHGIDMATVHATFLAESISDWFSGTASEDDALATYHQRRNAHGLDAYYQTISLANA
jgi:flavin-dependent dehydrogenase